MNKDNLEEFIRDNRDAFDDKAPPALAWDKIQQRIPQNNQNQKQAKRFSLWQIARVAAAIVLLVGTGIIIGRQTADSTEALAVENNYPEFIEAKAYYETEVRKKLTQLASFNYDTSIDEDMLQLDNFMKELKEELEESPKGSEEMIISTIITNYQIKLDILERVLESFKTSNQKQVNSKDDEINI